MEIHITSLSIMLAAEKFIHAYIIDSIVAKVVKPEKKKRNEMKRTKKMKSIASSKNSNATQMIICGNTQIKKSNPSMQVSLLSSLSLINKGKNNVTGCQNTIVKPSRAELFVFLWVKC